MAKRSPKKSASPWNGPSLFASLGTRRRRVLILPRHLAEEAEHMNYRGPRQDKAHALLKKWADLELQGYLAKKETSLDADFLLEVFGEALGYLPSNASPLKYNLERNYTVPGVGTADGAVGEFTPDNGPPAAVIELKDIDADLDRDRFNGRTAVQQCWDYLNALPQCPWGIVSNFVTIRLYHRDKTPQAYQEFKLQDLRELEAFRQFYCLFEKGGLLPTFAGGPRALRLLASSESRQREIGDQLYESYSDNRFRLIEELRFKHQQPVDEAIRIAQKIIDRIVFVAFCEDRGLLPEQCIESAYSNLPPFSKVTNPRWRNFLDLFQAIDKGHNKLLLDNGYNGGLFRHDPAVDDLQLNDSWAEFFRNVGHYDFRDEVNVEVLGHLFEKSVGELERLRTAGMFEAAGRGTDDAGLPTMPKSPERKRFGIYYTPQPFTVALVDKTLSPLIQERHETIRRELGWMDKPLDADEPTPVLAEYYRRCLAALRELRICDPACGSGAFLIQAYDLLEDHYYLILEKLSFHEQSPLEVLLASLSDWILQDNLFGVDLSDQAVEITQLSLWIRSARRGQTLADLSNNIVKGNSLVADPAAHPHALVWTTRFPAVFQRPEPGFDAVIGNPPWERLKLQEREYFAFSAPKIAAAVSAAQRRRLIDQLAKKNPELHARYLQAKESAEKTLAHARACGAFPLTAKGDVNTYMLFAELAKTLVAAHGRVGLLIPSGIATDHTTREFFQQLIDQKKLIALHDFENRLRPFADVDGRFKFCMFRFGGAATTFNQADFVFFAHQMEDLSDKRRHIALTAKDLALFNPNTRTCPIFRGQRDAELTKAIYRRVPILIDHNRREGGNPWGVRFMRMFDQTNDAELFVPPADLKAQGFRLDGSRWVKGKQTYLPLYEAKMVQAYDHRAASVVIREGNWMRQGQTEAASLVEHQNPEFSALPRWWVAKEKVIEKLGDKSKPGLVGFKDITSPTNERTMIAAFIPWSGVVNHFPLLFSDQPYRLQSCLLANLNSFILDYVTRQKIGGVTLNFFIVEQLPIFPPDHYAQPCPWAKRQTLEKWLSERVLKLTCTANDMKPLAAAADFDPPVHKWSDQERQELMAELDAAFFLLYGLARKDTEFILETFRDEDPTASLPGMMGDNEAILEAYDRLAEKAG